LSTLKKIKREGLWKGHGIPQGLRRELVFCDERREKALTGQIVNAKVAKITTNKKRLGHHLRREGPEIPRRAGSYEFDIPVGR